MEQFPLNAPVAREELPKMELPERYGRDTLVLMARDPEWVFSYWELTDELIKVLDRGTPLLRVIGAEGPVYQSRPDLPVGKHYIRVPKAGHYRVELGCTGEGRFQAYLVSNDVTTPMGGPAGFPTFVGAVAAGERELAEEAYRRYKESLKNYASSPGIWGT